MSDANADIVEGLDRIGRALEERVAGHEGLTQIIPGGDGWEAVYHTKERGYTSEPIAAWGLTAFGTVRALISNGDGILIAPQEQCGFLRVERGWEERVVQIMPATPGLVAVWGDAEGEYREPVVAWALKDNGEVVALSLDMSTGQVDPVDSAQDFRRIEQCQLGNRSDGVPA